MYAYMCVVCVRVCAVSVKVSILVRCPDFGVYTKCIYQGVHMYILGVPPYVAILISVAPIYTHFFTFTDTPIPVTDMPIFTDILQNRGGGAENHLKFMCINCICNDNVINVINCVGSQLYSQVIIKHLSQLIKQCF